MICKTLLYKKFFSILLRLSISFILVSSPQVIEEKFDKVDFYESFSNPEGCFHIYHNYPSSPPFLLAHIKYKSIPKINNDSENIINMNYQLKGIDEPCLNSLILPSLINKKIIDLEVNLYLYYLEKPLATFYYIFDEDFNSNQLIIVNTKNYFGLQVEFSDSAIENSVMYDPHSLQVKYYINSLQKNTGLICIVTQNNNPYILWPEYMPFRYNELITGVQFTYMQNERIYLTVDYPAFECTQNRTNSMDIIFLIYNGYQGSIIVKWIYSFVNLLNRVVHYNPTSFLNLHLINIDDIENLPLGSKKIFFLETIQTYNRGPNNELIIEKIFETNNIKLVTTCLYSEILPGVKRVKWFSYF